jgi:small conductance mechanosensitive channel
MQDFLTTFSNWVAQHGPLLLRNLIVFLVILLIGWILANVVDRALNAAIERSRYQPSPLFGQFVVNVARKTVWIVAIVLGLDNLGIDTAALIAGLGATGIILGFALKDTLSNFASGAMILLYSPFDVGDFIEVAGESGTVRDLTLVNTVLHTGDRKIITLPNSKVWGSAIVNYDASDIRRIDLVAGIAYGDDVDKAKDLFSEILADHPKILDDPAPVVRINELGGSSVNFDVRGFVKGEDYWEVRPELLRTLKVRCDEEGLEIPFPQQDIWVRNADDLAASAAE